MSEETAAGAVGQVEPEGFEQIEPEVAAEAVESTAGPEAEVESVDAQDAHEQSDRADATLGAPSLAAALEALLLVADQPLDIVTLAQVVRRPVPEVQAAVAALAAEYTEAQRGFDLRQVGNGWRFYTRAECAEVVERFVTDGQQARLTQAALETLAVVAYRQPVSRGRVGAVRGVNVDGVMRTLVSRGLVEEAGTEHETGATLYRTTPYFLERLGLASLEELPPVADYLPALEQLDDLGDSGAF